MNRFAHFSFTNIIKIKDTNTFEDGGERERERKKERKRGDIAIIDRFEAIAKGVGCCLRTSPAGFPMGNGPL